MNVKLSKLEASDLDPVNELIERSKARWYPDEDYLERAMKLIRITPEWMEENEGWTCYEGDELIGFLGYSRYDDYWYLEHLWIHPDKFGQNYGSQLIEFLFDRARQSSIHKISLLPEPKAEKFYAKFGAVFTKVDVPSLHEGGPVFKEMVIHI